MAGLPLGALPILALPEVPSQAEVDRHLSSYEQYVHVTDVLGEPTTALGLEARA